MKSPINADKADNCYHGSFHRLKKLLMKQEEFSTGK